MYWQGELLDASFRGAPFHIEAHQANTGRRGVQHEFPLRDEPFSQDLGRKSRQYRVRGYVIGEGYFIARRALFDACEAPGPATLVHPYLGELTVLCVDCTQAEETEAGGIATFDLTFLEWGQVPSPVSVDDTASQLLAALDSINAVLATAFSVIADPRGLLGIVGGALVGKAMTYALGALFGFGAGLYGGIASLFDEAGSDFDPELTPAAISVAFTSAADGIVAGVSTPSQAYDPVLGDASLPPLPLDPSRGFATVARFGDDLNIPTDAGQASNQAATLALVRGLAIVAMARIYTEITFQSANEAQGARAEILALIDDQAVAAADIGDDAVYLAWQAMGQIVSADMTSRVLALPLLGTYTVGATLPALVLAQRLYADPRRASELVALNGAIHPLFMPLSGVALAS